MVGTLINVFPLSLSQKDKKERLKSNIVNVQSVTVVYLAKIVTSVTREPKKDCIWERANLVLATDTVTNAIPKPELAP